MAAVIKDIDHGFQRVVYDFKALRNRSVKVGIFGNEQAEGTSVIDYAIYNEFGTSRTPARPFMAHTAELYLDDMAQFVDFMTGRIIAGSTTADTVLKSMGMKYQSYIRKTIRDAKTWAEPNAASTVAMKGSSSPLIDEGRMIGAVNYEVT